MTGHRALRRSRARRAGSSRAWLLVGLALLSAFVLTAWLAGHHIGLSQAPPGSAPVALPAQVVLALQANDANGILHHPHSRKSSSAPETPEQEPCQLSVFCCLSITEILKTGLYTAVGLMVSGVVLTLWQNPALSPADLTDPTSPHYEHTEMQTAPQGLWTGLISENLHAFMMLGAIILAFLPLAIVLTAFYHIHRDQDRALEPYVGALIGFLLFGYFIVGPILVR